MPPPTGAGVNPAPSYGHSVVLVTHAEVEREGWTHFPIVFEEYREVVLMGVGQFFWSDPGNCSTESHGRVSE